MSPRPHLAAVPMKLAEEDKDVNEGGGTKTREEENSRDIPGMHYEDLMTKWT